MQGVDRTPSQKSSLGTKKEGVLVQGKEKPGERADCCPCQSQWFTAASGEYLTDMWPRRQWPGLSHPGDRQTWSGVTAQSWIAEGWAGVMNQGWDGTRGQVPYVPGDGNSPTIPSKPCLMGKSGWLAPWGPELCSEGFVDTIQSARPEKILPTV